MDAISALKGLSDAADEKIRSGKDHDKGLAEWFDLVKQAALYIADDDEITSETSQRKSTKKKGLLPDILSFVTEVEVMPKKKQRLSSTLAHMQKDHISHSRRNSRGNASKLDASSSSTKQDAAFDETFVKQTPCRDGAVETPLGEARTDQTVNVSNEDQGFYTPVDTKPHVPPLQTETVVRSERASLKRKSSSPPHSETVSPKKAKVAQGATVSVVKKSLRKSLKGNGKISGNKFFKHRLPSTKISSGGVSSSVLKENRKPKTKTENDEENPTLKKVLAARQTKIQEAKRKREEKMQKTSQQRQKLEKEKGERLKCSKHKEVEKSLLKTVLQSKKTRAQEMEKNHNSEVDSERPSTRSTKNSAKANYSSTPMKTPRKNTKMAEETNKKEKEDLNTTYATNSSSSDTNVKHLLSNKISKTNISNTPVRSPRKKDALKIAEETNRNSKEDIKNTLTTKSTSSDSKEISTVLKKVASPTEGNFTKTPVPIQRTISSSNSTLNGSGNILKQNGAPATPLASKENNLSQQSSILQSYQMTPARESFVNYDISEIKSDDSDEEDTTPNKKPVPGWASGNRLRNALIQQQYRPIDTDYVFGNVFGTIQLCDIMGVQNKRYFKRTSSAIWNSPSAFK